eukprot:scaffold42343_cov75-Phaeocystis_antarctica.AAC.4
MDVHPDAQPLERCHRIGKRLTVARQRTRIEWACACEAQARLHLLAQLRQAAAQMLKRRLCGLGRHAGHLVLLKEPKRREATQGLASSLQCKARGPIDATKQPFVDAVIGLGKHDARAVLAPLRYRRLVCVAHEGERVQECGTGRHVPVAHRHAELLEVCLEVELDLALGLWRQPAAHLLARHFDSRDGRWLVAPGRRLLFEGLNGSA